MHIYEFQTPKFLENEEFLHKNFHCVGDEAAQSDDSSWSMDCSTVLKVKDIHISSPILAAKSPFFYKVRSDFIVQCLPLF